jgi:Na+/melibiose symporter-like transporter
VEAFGFAANSTQSASSLLGIRLTSSLIPAVTFLISTAALLYYPITKKVNEHMQVELDERRKNQ